MKKEKFKKEKRKKRKESKKMVEMRNVRKCACKLCKKTLEVGEGKRVSYHGKSYFFVCDDCSGYNWYSNDDPRLKQTKDGFVYALEIEEAMQNINENKLRLLGYVRKSECTVYGDEWVSQPIRNLNGLAKMLRYQLQHGLIVESGTHLNMSNEFYDNNFYQFCIDHYHEIFSALHSELSVRPLKTEMVFGRDLQEWCDGCNPFGKSTFIRIENNIDTHTENRFEFRIAQLVTPTQYLQTIKHCRNIMTIIYNGYINNDDTISIASDLVKWWNKI